MKRLVFWLVSLLLSACGGAQTPPQLTPLRSTPAAPLSCADFFPQGDWQYLHAIHFRLASGGSGSALGVVVLTSRDIRCALTTVEGLTLFEARTRDSGQAEILRALPPFDQQHFADNLIKDIRTLFIPPLGLVRQGQLADKARVCRYETADGETADLMETKDGCWRLQTYNPDPLNNRSVRAYSCEYTSQSGLMPSQLELTAPGRNGYSVHLRLISAQRLSATP